MRRRSRWRMWRAAWCPERDGGYSWYIVTPLGIIHVFNGGVDPLRDVKQTGFTLQWGFDAACLSDIGRCMFWHEFKRLKASVRTRSIAEE